MESGKLALFLFDRYWGDPETIFIDGLVGGLFIASVIQPTRDSSCHIHEFFWLMQLIAFSHYSQVLISSIRVFIGDVRDYAQTTHRILKWLQNGLLIIQHLGKLVQFCLISWLAYVVVVNTPRLATGSLTTDRNATCIDNNDTIFVAEESRASGKSCSFCERSTILLAVVVVGFQFSYGLSKLITWCIIYSSDKDDLAEEKAEMTDWVSKEKRLWKTSWGLARNSIIVMCMDPFFETGIASAMLSLSLSLPNTACMSVISWFQFGGLVHLLDYILDDCSYQVFKDTKRDKVINNTEHKVLITLKMLRFPIFVAEIVVFLGISINYILLYPVVSFSGQGEYVCEKSVWSFCLLVFIVYTAVLLVRILIFIGTIQSKEIESSEGEERKFEDTIEFSRHHESKHKLHLRKVARTAGVVRHARH